jgi:dihydroorotate dehydrogenase electron transfer subunit
VSRKLSDILTNANMLRVSPLKKVERVSASAKVLSLEDAFCSRAEPGQFVMLWVPGVDEIPLSVLDASRGVVSMAVKEVGEATRALLSMKSGDLVGVRGPFGNSFSVNAGKVLLVGGGTGVAPLLFLAKKLTGKAESVSFVMGAKTKDELLFLGEFVSLCSAETSVAATEDGSYGLKCLATDPLDKLLSKEKFDFVYTCGPELMMRRVFELAEVHGVPVEASLERLMRCGIGLCGSCVLGRFRVCRDGPVFDSSMLRSVKKEFGFSKLGFDGKRVPV